MPDISDEHTRLRTASLVVLAVLAAAVALYYTAGVMIPFVLAIFTVSLVSPVLDFQVLRLKFPRPLATAVTLLLVIALVAGVLILVAGALQMIIAGVRPYTASFSQLAQRITEKITEWGIEVDQAQIVEGLRNRIPAIITNTMGTAFGVISSIFLVIIFVAFLLAGRNPHVVSSGIYGDIDHQVRKYIATKIALSAVTGLLVWITLYALGLELAAVFGILAFLLNFIPSIGSIVATLLPIPIAIAQFQTIWPSVYVIAVPGSIQMVIGNVIEPKLMGRELNLHPVTVLLALSFWGLLWGLAGMFLAVPITAMLSIILMQFESLKPIAALFSGRLPNPPQSDTPPADRSETSKPPTDTAEQ